MSICPYCNEEAARQIDPYSWFCDNCGMQWDDYGDDPIEADLGDWMFDLLDGTDDDTKPTNDHLN